MLSRKADALLLLFPGAIAALGLFAMSASAIPGLNDRVAANFLLFMPWQALGLTVAKFGLDSWILGRGVQWTGASLPLRKLVLTRTLPAAAVMTLMMSARLPPLLALAGGISVLFDAVALILSSELSSQGRVRHAAASHFLRYPLFFACLPIIGLCGKYQEAMLYLVFAGSSAARLACLRSMRSSARAPGNSAPGTGHLALQQVLNYGLFKNDQLAFSMLPVDLHAVRQMLVYVVRFPELVSAAIVSVGPLIYPALMPKNAQGPGNGRSPLLLFVLAAILFCGLGGIAYRAVAPPALTIPWYAIAAVVMHAALVLPVNVYTYGCFAAGRERDLVRALAFANAVGISVVLAILFTDRFPASAILWTIPVQQIAFIFFVGRKQGHVSTPARALP